MKHSTFYNSKGQISVYTTIKLTDHHKFLREDYEGRTYSHEDNAALYFIESMPLDRPIPIIEEII